jgi:branched-chain amino acid transport system substrate-binding protein
MPYRSPHDHSFSSPRFLLTAACLLLTLTCHQACADSLRLGLLHPTTGRYKAEGYDQAQGAMLAVEEINASGGILGRKVELLMADTASSQEHGSEAARELLSKGANMLFGGVSSSVIMDAGEEARRQNKLFFATMGSANDITEENGHSHIFREYYNAWMTAKALAFYLNQNLHGKRIFYITADYSWGISTEESIRNFTHTEDQQQHPGIRVSFPRPRRQELQTAMDAAQASGADILMLIQFGEDMATTLTMAESMRLKQQMQIVVPNLTESMAISAGAGAMEDVIGTTPWCWQATELYDFARGKAFVANYRQHYQQYPGSPAASAYSMVYQYRDAVTRAGSADTAAVSKALSNYRYHLLKDQQVWRSFDHQNIQSVFVIRGKKRADVMKSVLRSDYFDVVLTVPGTVAAKTQEEWLTVRQQAGKPENL